MEESALQQPELIGRDMELNQLNQSLTNAMAGRGSTIFIAGEAGVGKTRLAEECIHNASSMGFKVMRGWCLSRCMTPFLPMRELLASGGLEHLVTLEVPPRLETVLLIAQTGIVLSKQEREGSGIDIDIFSGMLTAVNEFIKDTMKQMGRLPEGDVSRLGYGDFNISCIHGRYASLAAIYKGRENEALLGDLQQTLAELEARFGGKLVHFDGLVDEFTGAKDSLKEMFDSERFDGIDWAKGDPKSKQNSIFENVLKGLERETKARPILLFIDDLQWADPSTLALLHYISRNTRASRLFMLATYRAEDILASWDGKMHQLKEAIQLMSGEGLLERVELRNLGRDAVTGLVGATLGKVDGRDEFVDFLWRETQGNPLFAVEVINLLKGEGALVHKDGAWSLTKRPDTIDLPVKIHDVISRRLARLPKDQMLILEPASVIGDVFTSDVLSKVAEVKKIELLKNLSEIERSHGLIVSMERNYAFSHVKIREVLYSGLPGELRREYHGMVGDSITDLYGASDEVVAEAGYHFYMARDANKALPNLRRAIELAKAQYANKETLRYSNYALELMEMDGRKRGAELARLLEEMGEVYEITGRLDEAKTAFERVKDLSDDPEVIARVHRKVSSIYATRGEYDRVADELEKARVLVAAGEGVEFARILSAIGAVQEHKGLYEEAISKENRALEIFQKLSGTEKDVADVLHRMGQLYVDIGDYDRGLVNFHKALEEFERIGYLRGTGIALNSIGHILADRDRYAEALEVFERSLKTFEKLGDTLSIGVALNNLGIVYKSMSDYDRAHDNYERCHAVFQRLGHPRGMGSTLNNLAVIYHTRGDHTKSLEFHRRALDIFTKLGDKIGEAMMELNMSLVQLQTGDFEGARANIEAAEKATLEMGNKRLMVDILQAKGELLIKTGKSDEAEEFVKKTIELAKELDVKEGEGISHRFWGMIEAGRGNWPEAEDHFKTSITVLTSAKIKLELAETYLEYGRAMKKKGIPAAKDMLGKALRTFEELKLGYKVEIVRRELG